MIIAGVLYRAGSIIEKDSIPEGLRKRENYCRLDEEENVIRPTSRIVPPPPVEEERRGRITRKHRFGGDAGISRNVHRREREQSTED